jgi:hypothetical protein
MRTLEQCELAIKRGFAEAGKAFKEIRDRRLYKKSYSRFEDYCQKTWNANRNYVNKLIRASDTMDNLGTNGTQKLPSNEREVRPLTVLETAKEQKEVYEVAAMTAPNGKVTAKHVAHVVDTYKHVKDIGGDTATLLHVVRTPEQLADYEKDLDKRAGEAQKRIAIRQEQNKAPLSDKLTKTYTKDFNEWWKPIEEVRSKREQLDIARLYLTFLIEKYPVLRSELTLHVVEKAS